MRWCKCEHEPISLAVSWSAKNCVRNIWSQWIYFSCLSTGMRHAFYLSEPASQPASSTSNRRSTTLLTNPSSLLSIRMCTVCIVAGVHRIWTKVGCCCFYSFCQKISKIRVQLTLLVGYLISSRHKSISFQVGILAFVRRVTSNTLMTCVHKRNEKK